MESVVGKITSKTTGIQYSVKWNVDDHESWIQRKKYWQKVCTKVYSAEEAISCAQQFIDGQPELF
jgi:hypothetical protein